MTPAEVVAAIDRGYRWSILTNDKPAVLARRVTGRLTITNYDLNQLGNDERKRLNMEIDRVPPDHIFVDIRPEFPGGQYPLRGICLTAELQRDHLVRRARDRRGCRVSCRPRSQDRRSATQSGPCTGDRRILVPADRC